MTVLRERLAISHFKRLLHSVRASLINKHLTGTMDPTIHTVSLSRQKRQGNRKKQKGREEWEGREEHKSVGLRFEEWEHQQMPVHANCRASHFSKTPAKTCRNAFVGKKHCRKCMQSFCWTGSALRFLCLFKNTGTHLPYWMFVTGWRCSPELAEAATGRELPLRTHNESRAALRKSGKSPDCLGPAKFGRTR